MGKRATVKADGTKAIAYLRVSTDEQHLGPEAQRGAIERWAQANGVTIVGWHVDKGVSGGAAIQDRPGLLAAIEALREHGAGVLVVAKRDRLARDTMVAAMVERLAERVGARILAADGAGNGEGPEAFIMRGMMDLLAQYERLIIKARTKAALGVKRAKGERVGGIPLGRKLADDGRTLEANEGEIAVIERVRALRAFGVSVRGIVTALAGEGFTSRTGRPFTKGSVENMLACIAA